MDISRWRLEGGVDYRFAEGTTVPGRGYLVVPIDPLQPVQATSAGFTGRLANDGEELRLVSNNGRVMNVVNYQDNGHWPVGPDGGGVSLAKQNRNAASHPPENWTDCGRVENFQRTVEENKEVVDAWKSAQHNKARDIASAKVINEVEQSPEEVLAS